MTLLGKTYRVKRKGRFTLFIICLLMFAAVCTGVVLGVGDSGGPVLREYVEITVRYGDTLWGIAGRYMSDAGDIRRAVFELSTLNETNPHELRAGQVLVVPVSVYE